MTEIKSNLSSAADVSAQLSRVASGFSSVNVTTNIAERTTIAGNMNAKNSLKSIYDRGQRLSNAIVRDGDSIHSVAKEFSKIDLEVKNSFDNLSPLSPLNGGRLER